MARVLERIDRLESGQRETNVNLVRMDNHLASIDSTLHTVSRVFELMNERLERLEDGQMIVVDRLERLDGGLERLDGGQKLIVDRLDRLIEATMRDRTVFIERLARVETRLDAVEEKLERRS